MASVKERFDDLVPAIEADVTSAWASGSIYRGRPRLTITEATLGANGVAVLLVGDVAQNFNAGFGAVEQVWTVDVLGMFKLPSDPADSVMEFLVEKADLLVNQFEARTVWPGGGVLALVEQVIFDDEGEEGVCACVVRLTVRYHCLPTAPS